MAVPAAGRGVVVTASAMIVVAQVLAIANDVVLRQSDPPDVVLLVVLIGLSVLMVRRVRWARWTTVALVALGGVLELASVPLLIATVTSPGFWLAVESAAPGLRGLHAAVVVFAASPAFPILTGSVIISSMLNLIAAAMLLFAPSIRIFFSADAAASSA